MLSVPVCATVVQHGAISVFGSGARLRSQGNSSRAQAIASLSDLDHPTDRSKSSPFFVGKAGFKVSLSDWEYATERSLANTSPFFVRKAGVSLSQFKQSTLAAAAPFAHPLLSTIVSDEPIGYVDEAAVYVDQDPDSIEALAMEASRILQGRSIFLVGMMGSGKSTVGNVLASALGYGFLDSDLVVEKTQSSPVADIFKLKGEAAFRELETEVIADLSLTPGLVVATGGGAVIRNENWNCMKNGVTVWINVPIDDLANRVVAAGTGSRPLLAAEEGEDPREKALSKLRMIWRQRHDMYAKADIILNLQDIAACEGAPVAEVSTEKTVQQMLKDIMKKLDYKKSTSISALRAASGA